MIEIVGVGDDATLRPGDVEDKDERIAGPGDERAQNFSGDTGLIRSD